MFDFGAWTTAIGTLAGALVAAYATWRNTKSTDLSTEANLELQKDQEYHKEQREWREELKVENHVLRELAEKKRNTIEKLLDERITLKQQMSELSGVVNELRHEVIILKQRVAEYESPSSSQHTTEKA